MEAKELIEEVRVLQKDADYRKLKITGGNKVDYNFSDYKTFKELFKDFYYKENYNRWWTSKTRRI